MTLKRELSKVLYRNYFTKNRFKIYRRQGVLFLLNLKNSIDRKIIFNGIFEKEQIFSMIEAAKKIKPDYFIDVGANLGLYSVIVANSPDVKRVIAFEPDKSNYSQLRANILINNLMTKISSFEKGLSDKNDVEEFYKNKGRDTGTSRIKGLKPMEADNNNQFELCSIDVVRLDDLLELENKNIFLKMDIEGHEFFAFEGMRALLLNNNCRIQVEVFNDNFEKVDALLKTLGYAISEQFGVDRIYEKF